MRPEDVLSTLELAYLDIGEEVCPDCGYVECRCDEDVYGDAWELAVREERDL